MHAILQSLGHFFFALGGVGVLLLGILDSSFLLLPLGNDLLVVALMAAHKEHLVYYVAMATAGSVIGVWIAHWVSSRGGQMAIEGKQKSRQVAYVERKVEKYGGVAIAVAALAPPGFPFTAFIVVSAALQYPVKRMLAIIGACRLVRFSLEAWLAVVYGPKILQLAKSPLAEKFIMGLVVISTVGSALSIWKWVRKSAVRPSPGA